MENPRSFFPPEESASSPSSEETSFGSILQEFERQRRNGAGEALHGTVVSITPESVFVDIGRKMEGVLPALQFREPSGELSVHTGDQLLVTVTGRNEEGNYLLSTLKVERAKDWSGFEKAFAEKRIIGGTVTELVKGGLRVDVGVPAFLPASRSGVREQADLEKLVGQQIECRIIKLDVADEDIVVDRRAVLEERAAEARDQAFTTLKEGSVVHGQVRSLTDFGAFIEIAPGVDGLLHVSDMAWQRISKPSDVVSPGDSLDVRILKINPETRKVSLGLKQLQPDPWTLAGERFHVGDRVQGKVSRLTDFGAFVEIAPGVDGLIHVSELSWSKKIRKPSDVLKTGEMVEALVLGVNIPEKRISLGLKQALGDPWEEAQKKFTPGTIAEGPVTSLQPFGAFIDLGNGIEGLIHVGDISREKRLKHPREALTLGQSVRAVVLEQDAEHRRIKLGMKQLEPTSIDHYIAEHQVGEVVTGRLVEVSGGRATAELGEGIQVACRLKESEPEASSSQPKPAGDISSLSAMLSAKWKQGSAPGGAQKNPEQARSGQVRSFRITALDPAKKTVEVELAG